MTTYNVIKRVHEKVEDSRFHSGFRHTFTDTILTEGCTRSVAKTTREREMEQAPDNVEIFLVRT